MMQEELTESDSNREAQLLYGNTDKYGIYQLRIIRNWISFALRERKA